MGSECVQRFKGVTSDFNYCPWFILGHYKPDLSLVPHNGNTSPVGFIQMIAFAVIASLWAYEGWTNLNTVAGEMKNPQRNLPRALILSV